MSSRKFFLVIGIILSCIKTDKATIAFRPILPFFLSSPITHKISVTGSFGEIRSNHFHAGIDFRSSKGIDGDSLISAAPGFIRKIKIDSKNYGKSLLIEHEGGYSTFYAHILRFRSDIEDKIKTEQYKRQENELELELNPEDIPVATGELVAFMGNTGDSRGSHLHFEVRITGTDQVVDPSEFGLPIEDHIPPHLNRFKLYGFDLDGRQVSEKLIHSSKLNKVLIPGDVFGMAVEAYDRSNNSWRNIGIKSVRMFVDHSLFYSFSLDSWSLQDARYLNAHIDYESRFQGRFHRCFKLQGNKIPIYTSVENDGFYYIGDGKEHHVELYISDALGNETKKEFTIQNAQYKVQNTKIELPYTLYFDRRFEHDFGFGKFLLEAGCIYDHVHCKIDTISNSSHSCFCPWIGISPNNTPLHKPIEISLKPVKLIPQEMIDKCFVGLKRGKAAVSLNGEWKDGVLIAKSKQLGYFSILTDTIAPRLNPKNFKYNMLGRKSMSFTMTDNVADVTEKRSSIKYNAYIDGQWIILEHDLKSRTITHQFEPWLSTGTHELIIVLEDVRKNRKEYKYTFLI
ncbi:MAG: M23 family metallopeptidase [Saprospiraceae bacterium]|nr:M23 family metallopeptidase [Saprospiraceae bacterium]